MAHIVMLMHEQEGSFGASFPDLPGCITVASGPDALIAKASEAVAFHLEGLAEDGVVPVFRSVSDLQDDPDFREDAVGATLVLLEVERPTRTVRVNISVDEAVLQRIDRAADAAGESRSGFLVAAAKARLRATS